MAEVTGIVAYLTEYVDVHFGTEEKFMDLYTYSSAFRSKPMVKTFTDRVERLQCGIYIHHGSPG